MKIERLKSLVKCDIASCRRKADYTIVSGVSVSQNINLCHDCAVEIYEALGRILVPKSPHNMLNKSESTIKESESERASDVRENGKKAAAAKNVKKTASKQPEGR